MRAFRLLRALSSIISPPDKISLVVFTTWEYLCVRLELIILNMPDMLMLVRVGVRVVMLAEVVVTRAC